MHKIILTIAILFTSLIYAQEYKIKKIESPQYGNIAKGKTRITITDSLIIISDKKKLSKYVIQGHEEVDQEKKYYTLSSGKKNIVFTINEIKKKIIAKPKEEVTENMLELIFSY